MLKESINAIIDAGMEHLIADLQRLIRQPSISAKNEGINDCANLVAHIMERAGIHSEVLTLDTRASGKIDIPPVVFGEVRPKINANSRTLLFYNHYDVQPVDPVELWEEDPFSGKVEGEIICGRGSADDKGELITRIKAVEFLLKKYGDVPCNIKFVVEGEEEIGSAHIEKYLLKYKHKFGAHGVIWEFGYVDNNSRPIISLGMKGLLYVELVAKGPTRDVHSSLAVVIENPAWRLVKALSSLRSESGEILIEDWYKEVRQVTLEELELISREPFDEQEFRDQYGLEGLLNNIQGVEVNKALVGMPTCNIAGFVAGYTGEGSKTILPSSALAKVDFRLVPDMEPKTQFNRLKAHLRRNGFGDLVEVRFIHGEPAYRTPVNNSLVKLVESSAAQAFGTDPIISVSSSGTGPMHSFSTILSAPCVSVGSTYVFSRIHSPNEFARIDFLNKATKCVVNIIERFGSVKE